MIGKLWIMSLQAGMLICIVPAVRLFLRKYSGLYIYGIWMLVLFRLLCPVFMESPFGILPENSFWQRVTESEMGFSETGTYRKLHDGDPSIGGNPKGAEGYGGGTTLKETGGTKPQKATGYHGETILVLKIIYLFGFGAVTMFFLVQKKRMRRKTKTAVREAPDVWLCDGIETPFVMGIFQPKIYLPYGLSESQREHIIRHERVHLLHWDTRIRFLMAAALCLHWWNPLVWYAYYKACQDMEMYCDETVLNHADMKERKAYAMTLLQFSMRRSGIPAMLSFAENLTEKRIKNVLTIRERSRLARAVVVIFGMIGIGLCFSIRPSIQVQPTEEPLMTDAGEENADDGAYLVSDGEKNAPDINDLYGTWEIVRADYRGIHALSVQEIERYLGSTLSFTEEEAYQVAEIDAEVFMQGFSKAFEDLLHSDGAVLEVSGARDEVSFDSQVYLVDQKTLLVFRDGVFFVGEKR